MRRALAVALAVAVLFAKGLEIDLAHQLARQLGVPAVRFVNEDRFATLISGAPSDWDVAISQITITPDRATRLDFSRPYFKADQGVLLRRGLSAPQATLAGLRDLRLCAERGTTGATTAQRTIRPRRKVRLVGNLSRLEAVLYRRACDAAVADAPQLGVMRAQAPDRFGPLLGRVATGERYGVALPRGSALRPSVDAALTRLEEDGTLARLARKWLTTDVGRLPVLR
jgi:polar amino acid transport system substrate-binding protein